MISCAPYGIFPIVKVTRHSFKFIKNRQEPGSVSFPKAGGDDKACPAPLPCLFISVHKHVLFVFGEKSRTLCLYSQEAYKVSLSLLNTRKNTCNGVYFQESEVAKERASAGSASDCSGGIPVEFRWSARSTTG